MKCANHPDREASAFCQNCGKPLCPECVRTLGTSLVCDRCLELRAAAGATPPPGFYAQPSVAGGSPGIAVLLGFIPGVGAMYNGQYAKGLVHLAVFAILVSLADHNGVFGLFIAGWICYMVLDAYQTARARRDGAPLPNPFGLNELGERLGFGRVAPSYGSYSAQASGQVPPTSAVPGVAGQPAYNYGYTYSDPGSSWGAPQEGYAPVPLTDVPVPPVPDSPYSDSRRVPAGAVWLIALGLIFLLGNMGLFWIRARFVGPLLLIALAVWMFLRHMTAGGHSIEGDGTPAYSARLSRAVGSSMWLAGTGVMWLLDVLGVLPWSRSWPLFLILGGLAMILRRTVGAPAFPAGYGFPPQSPQPPTAPVAPAPGAATISTNAETSAEPGPREGR